MGYEHLLTIASGTEWSTSEKHSSIILYDTGGISINTLNWCYGASHYEKTVSTQTAHTSSFALHSGTIKLHPTERCCLSEKTIRMAGIKQTANRLRYTLTHTHTHTHTHECKYINILISTIHLPIQASQTGSYLSVSCVIMEHRYKRTQNSRRSFQLYGYLYISRCIWQ